MPKPFRPATGADVRRVAFAIERLREARDALAEVGADNAANAARRALSSAEGARRHIEARADRTAALAAPAGA